MENVGKRAANKADKKARILAAARQAFLEKGFAGATINDIAKDARVAKGTLFLYARHKGDLLSRVFHDELEPVITQSLAMPLQGPIIEWLLHHFKDVIAYTRQHQDICRMFLKELTWVTVDQRAITHKFMTNWQAGIEKVLGQAIVRGEVAEETDLATLGLLLIDVLLSAMRRWLADLSTYAEMETILGRTLAAIYRGLAPTSADASSTPALP